MNWQEVSAKQNHSGGLTFLFDSGDADGYEGATGGMARPQEVFTNVARRTGQRRGQQAEGSPCLHDRPRTARLDGQAMSVGQVPCQVCLQLELLVDGPAHRQQSHSSMFWVIFIWRFSPFFGSRCHNKWTQILWTTLDNLTDQIHLLNFLSINTIKREIWSYTHQTSHPFETNSQQHLKVPTTFYFCTFYDWHLASGQSEKCKPCACHLGFPNSRSQKSKTALSNKLKAEVGFCL